MVLLMKDLMERTNISRGVLNYYYNCGMFQEIERNAAGYRIFEESAVERLNKIVGFRREGKRLNKIKDLL